jgi:hypothetical protein
MPVQSVTSSPGTAKVSATPTATPTVSTPGVLSIAVSPSGFSYSGQATGALLKLKSSFSVTITDTTGSGAGWHVLAKINPLSSGSYTIPAASHTIEKVTISGVTGIAPQNSLIYPMIIPTVPGNIFSAESGTGMEQSTLTFNTQLIIPPEIPTGIYQLVLDVTIVAGP